jgi:hypothetical protein
MSYDTNTNATPEAVEAKPTKFPMTMGQARATVARSCAATIARSLEEFRTLKPADAVEEQDKQSIIRASQELFNTLIAQARKFDQPLIMRPDRSVKVVR